MPPAASATTLANKNTLITKKQRSTYPTNPVTRVKPEKVQAAIDGGPATKAKDPTSGLRKGAGLPAYSSSFPRGPNGKFMPRKQQQASNENEDSSYSNQQQAPPSFSSAAGTGFGGMMGYNTNASRNYSYYPSNAPGYRLC